MLRWHYLRRRNRAWADERYPNSHPDHEYSTHQCAQYGSFLTES